jgi:hypothetical protein
MAEVRCPMCGKANPEELDNCQFCQARMKPLVFSSRSEEDTPPNVPDPDLTKNAPEAGDEALPDWLRDLRPASEIDEEDSAADLEEPALAPAVDSADEMEWLNRIRPPQEAQEGPGSEPTPEEEAGFLAGLNNAAGEAESETPDWWRPTAEQPVPEESAPEITEWEVEEIPAAVEDLPPEVERGATSAEIPDLPSMPPEEAPAAEQSGKAAPEWQAEDLTEPEALAEDPAFSADLLDWVSESSPDQEEAGGTEGEADIPPAVLPSWLEALRPVEDAAPVLPRADKSSERIESAGPLAGLRGILRAEPEIARLQTPPSYSLKLRVTAAQRAHADLLTEIVEAEGTTIPIPKRPVVSGKHLLRWGIALALILAVLYAILAGGPPLLPASVPEEVAEVARLIDQMPAGAQTLVVFDYQPGLSGEVDAAAEAVVDHLMLGNASLSLVSTSPTGPLLAERFLAQLAAEHGYARNEQYVNLGYLAGGPSGLASFVQNPQRTLPYSLDGTVAWGTAGLPPLAGIARVSDFSLVMILADDPFFARAWVEQVQPFLVDEDGQTPLVMVLSAQSEPLVRPYYEASPRQVQGLIAGLRGGAAYSRLTGRDGLANAYWGAFSMGQSIAALVIVLGGLFGAYALLSRQVPLAGAEKDQQGDSS